MASRVLLVLVLVLVLADGHAAGGGGARGRKAGKHGARAKRGGAPAAAYGGGSTGRAEPADWAGPSAAVLAAVAELGLERCDFERFENGPAAVVAAAGDKRLSEEEFEARFLRRAPVVVTGLTDGWPGRDGWERAALLATHGAEEVGRGHWRHRLLAGAVPGWQRPISLSLSAHGALSTAAVLGACAGDARRGVGRGSVRSEGEGGEGDRFDSRWLGRQAHVGRQRQHRRRKQQAAEYRVRPLDRKPGLHPPGRRRVQSAAAARINAGHPAAALARAVRCRAADAHPRRLLAGSDTRPQAVVCLPARRPGRSAVPSTHCHPPGLLRQRL